MLSTKARLSNTQFAQQQQQKKQLEQQQQQQQQFAPQFYNRAPQSRIQTLAPMPQHRMDGAMSRNVYVRKPAKKPMHIRKLSAMDNSRDDIDNEDGERMREDETKILKTKAAKNEKISNVEMPMKQQHPKAKNKTKQQQQRNNNKAEVEEEEVEEVPKAMPQGKKEYMEREAKIKERLAEIDSQRNSAKRNKSTQLKTTTGTKASSTTKKQTKSKPASSNNKKTAAAASGDGETELHALKALRMKKLDEQRRNLNDYAARTLDYFSATNPGMSFLKQFALSNYLSAYGK